VSYYDNLLLKRVSYYDNLLLKRVSYYDNLGMFPNKIEQL